MVSATRAKRRLARSILDVHRAPEQVDLGAHDARLEAPELLEQPHARRAMNGRESTTLPAHGGHRRR